MKKNSNFLLISLACVLYLLPCSAQPPGGFLGPDTGDTARYLLSKLDSQHKVRYIHKPLDVLLTDIGIPVKSYLYGADQGNRFIVPYIFLGFRPAPDYSDGIPDDNSHALLIEIIWEDPPSMDSAVKVGHEDLSRWDDAAKHLYGQYLVKDVKLLHWKN